MAWGGLDFATTIQNDSRLDALVKKFKVDPATISLLVNTNSSFWKAELADWNKPQQVLLYPDLLKLPNNDNDQNNFPDFFKIVSQQANPPSALIVSADPFFFRFRTNLLKAAPQGKFDVPILFSISRICTQFSLGSKQAHGGWW